MSTYKLKSPYTGQKVDDLLDKIDALAPATESAAGTMSAEDKTKLNAIEAGAEKNKLEAVSVAGTNVPINNKTAQISVDATPTTGSTNLVKSGGVAEKISQLGQEVYKALHDNVIYAYSYDGTDLKIAYNDGNGLEYIYWFRKCMANELFTFWIVGYRSVERNEPSVENITINSQEITRFLTTISDNIGPVLFSNKWVGGAHLYEESVKTARTDNVSVYIDDNELPVNSSGICSKISIKVVNTIFNPNVAPSEGEEILSSPLLTEMVSYYIVKNNIEVAVLHKYFDNLVGSLNSYMGMQSVLIPTHILTPNGLYSDWTVTDGTMSFNKEDYPLFNRFIAKNSAGYLSAYLKSAFIGDHKFVLDANRIYHFSSNKNYHHLIDNTVITQVNNLSYQWKGTYTFFKDALIDSNGVTAYMGIIDDTDVIYVSVSSAKDSLIVPVPTSMTGKNIHVIENNGFTNENGSNKIEVGSAGIILKSTGAASFIAVFEDSVQDRNIDTNMLKSKDWSISGNVVYDSNDIPQSYNITWADGSAGTVVMSSFNEDVFEYSTITATYQSKTIVYNLTYDVNGYITNETINIQ